MSATLHYFAYGSNMLSVRLRRRVPESVPIGRGFVRGLERRFHKRGRDLSGKCGLWPAADSEVRLWGAVFAMPAAGKAALDAIEGVGSGYRVVELEVLLGSGGRRISAFSYRAEERYIDESLRPFTWYRDLVAAGAREHRLPALVVREIDAVAAGDDPDPDRERAARRILEGLEPGPGPEGVS